MGHSRGLRNKKDDALSLMSDSEDLEDQKSLMDRTPGIFNDFWDIFRTLLPDTFTSFNEETGSFPL